MTKSLLELFNVSLVPELFHIWLFLIITSRGFLFLTDLGLMMTNQFFQLLNSQLIESEFFLLIFQNQEFLFLLQSFLLELPFDHVNLVVPGLLRLLSLLL